MKRSWLVLLTITLVGLLAGVAIAGRPTTVDKTVIPARPVATTAAPTTTAPTTSGASPVTTSTLATTTSTEPTTTAATTTTAPEVDRGSFRVVAANGTTTLGLATRTTDQLRGLGYTQLVATDTLEPAAISTIYYRAGFAAAAAQLATDLGLASTATAELTEPVSQADGDGDVIAALGGDLAV